MLQDGRKLDSDKKNPKISIITVVYNGGDTIEATIKSVISQDYPNIEYIIIDGNSTDGTKEIIKKYEQWIDYWVSESDNGIYDAMNKGILKSTGDWINFMNSGDLYFDNKVLSTIFNNPNYPEKVLYGDSVSYNEVGEEKYWPAFNDSSLLRKQVIYRHGASFISSEVHKKYLFELNMSSKYGFALDYYQIFTMYRNNIQFKYIPTCILKYKEEGASNNILMQQIYMIRITRRVTFRNIILIILSLVNSTGRIINKFKGKNEKNN